MAKKRTHKQPLHPKVIRLGQALRRRRWEKQKERLPQYVTAVVIPLILTVIYLHRPQ